jgi:hypothetical protein
MTRRSSPQPNSLRVSSLILAAHDIRFGHCQYNNPTMTAASIIRHTNRGTEKWNSPLSDFLALGFLLDLLRILAFLLAI